MNMLEIKRIAENRGINITGIKKNDVIRAIQLAENNIDCYGTKRIDACGENACLWKSDCRKTNGNGKGNGNHK